MIEFVAILKTEQALEFFLRGGNSPWTATRQLRETGTNARVLLESQRGLPQEVRTKLESLVWEATSGKDELGISGNDCRVLLSIEGRFKQVSQEFCRLIGYEAKEFIGKRIAAFRTANIPQHLRAVVHFGNFHNLWMFTARVGRAMVVRCDWELFSDSTIVILGQPIRRDHLKPLSDRACSVGKATISAI